MPKLTKVLILLLVLVFVSACVWFFRYKDQYENPVSGLLPKVEMGFGRISNITDSTVDLRLDLLIHNPLPVQLDAEGFDYFVQMNGVTIIENEHADPLFVPAHDSMVIALPSTLKIKNLSHEGDAKAAKGEDSASYHFEALFRLKKSFLGKDTIRLSMDKRLPLYRLPKVEVAGYDIEKLRISSAEALIRLKFSNKNQFSIQFENPSYVVDLGKQKRFAEGQVESVTKIPAKSSDIFEIPLKIDMGKLIKTAGQFVVKGKTLPFTLYFKSKLISENDVFKDSDISIIVNGELNDLDKMKKNLSK